MDTSETSEYASELQSTSVLKQGAEARIYTGKYLGQPCVIKERFSKKYRHPVLDGTLTQQRTKSEVRSMLRCRTYGIKTPAVYFVDMNSNKIYMEYLWDSVTIRDHITMTTQSSDSVPSLRPLVYKIGAIIGSMHEKNIIHGDLTTSNMLLVNPVENNDVVLIDFGLGHQESMAEDKGVDLYVLERAFLSTHPNTEDLFEHLLEGYKGGYGRGWQEVIAKLEEVRMRGRKRTMVG